MKYKFISLQKFKKKKNSYLKNFFKKGAPFGLKWDEDDTILYCTTDEMEITDKVASFDLDSTCKKKTNQNIFALKKTTVVSVKSGAKFPKNRDDWVFWNESVPKKLKEYKEKGYMIVIFSNQAGIEKNKQNPEDLKGKILDICEELGFPVFCYFSTATDVNRKPNTS